jgi:hypothetical protein
VRRALVLLALLPALAGCGSAVPKDAARLSCAQLNAEAAQFREVARSILGQQPHLSAGALSISDAILSVEAQLRRVCGETGTGALRPAGEQWALTARAAAPPP